MVRQPVSPKVCAHIRQCADGKLRDLLTLNIDLIDANGNVLAEMSGLTLKKLIPGQIGGVRRADVRAPETPRSGETSRAASGLESAVRGGIGSHEGVEAFLKILRDGRHSQIAVSPLPLTPAVEPAPAPDQAAALAPATVAVEAAVVSGVGDGIELGVIEVLRKALGVQSLSPTDDFFEMGGDSLSAMRVVTQLKNRFATALPIGALFENPTAAALTAFMKQQIQKPGII